MNMDDKTSIAGRFGGPIAWFAGNGVAAKMMILVIAIGGLMSAYTIKKEVFPEFSSEMVTVAVTYRGAAPEEVENAVTVRIEEALQGVDGIDRIRSTSAEGASGVTVELIPGTDPAGVIDDIKAKVDAIDTFPAEAEKPVITELIVKSQVINIAVAGPADEVALKRIGERVRDEVSHLPGITQVELVVARPYEVSIEVSESGLRRYGLSFDEVAQAVRRSSLDLPGGSIKTDGGEFLLRVKGQAYRAPEFARLPLRTLPDGSRLVLGDVAEVIDGFEDRVQFARFNDLPAVVVQVFRVGDQDALKISQIIRDYAREATKRMPEGIVLAAYQDYSEYLRGRLNLLLKNAALGGICVFVVLSLFIRFRLAFWVSIGIPISFLGTLWLMPTIGVSINMLTLFAFLLVLGIVVDDAIVVSENIYTHVQTGDDGMTAAIKGAREVAVPVIFSVMTTVAAFAPMAAVEGNTGKVLKGIPLIVIPTLLFSLIESMWALPNHLSHLRKVDTKQRSRNPFIWVQNHFSNLLDRLIANVYRPFLDVCLAWRYLTVSVGLSSILLMVGLIACGVIQFQFFPPVEGDDVAAFLTMPAGTPPEATRRIVGQIEQAAHQVRREFDERHGFRTNSIFRNVLASVGDQPYRTAQSKNGGNNGRNYSRDNVGEVHIQLVPSEARPVSSKELVKRWRELVGPIPGAVESVFTADLFSAGNAINIQLSGPNVDRLREAAVELKEKLATFEGVFDLADSYRSGKQEIKLAIKPAAEASGLTLIDLARQVRQGFYGEEAQRIQRGRDDVRVMVRYPESERRSLHNLETMRVRLPDGTEVPFSSVAEAEIGRGFSTINRIDRERAINVTADVDLAKANPNDIITDVDQNFLPDLLARYPGLKYEYEGERSEQKKTMTGLARGFVLSVFIMFALIAIPLRSYFLPFVVMSAIPFGFVGAVLGHLVMGMKLTVLSMFGFVALAGVAVNDNLVLVDFVNRAKREGMTEDEAVRKAGPRRFRPILLTSLSTFFGLMPLILETSLQAQFLIPMAISLGFGVLYSTVTSLILVPSLYLIATDVRKAFAWLYGAR
ncbi:MAG: efflux RND transporter permease subunit [Verrucomicrobiae bacterium]|nr:efflux RND transporter permease subunit [Verrucomicrobiae bacterium]